MRTAPPEPMAPVAVAVTLGVDTHADVHVAAALDQRRPPPGDVHRPDAPRRLRRAGGVGAAGTAR